MATWLYEKARPAAFITYEVNQAYTREEHVLDAIAAAILPGTVVQYEAGKYGLVVNGVEKGRIEPTALIVKGHAIVIERLLVWPTVVAADGADAGTDNVAETIAATAAFQAAALAYFAAHDIIVRN